MTEVLTGPLWPCVEDGAHWGGEQGDRAEAVVVQEGEASGQDG